MARTINSVYLSGWEYNKLLQNDPLKPRNTALPAEILWNGAAQLWLFEKVLCTKESLESERYAAETLGWASCKIFAELADSRFGIIETVDWNRDLKETTKEALKARHKKLREDNKPEDIRSAIREKDVPDSIGFRGS